MVPEVAHKDTALLGEGPVWDERTQTLYWIDTRPGRLHRFTPADGTDLVTQLDQPLGSVALGENGGVVLAIEAGFGLLADPGAPEMRVIEVETELGGRRMNDGACDARGRFWAGTLAWDWTPGAGSLYTLEDDSVTRHLGGLTIANGIDWSPDDALMYYIDSATHRVDVFDFDLEAGVVSERRVFVDVRDLAGRPDGLTVDAEGGVWVAFSGGGCVRRYSADGEQSAQIDLPVAKVTNTIFGGAGLDELFITTGTFKQPGEPPRGDEPLAGSVFVCRPGVTGKPTHRFPWI